MRATRSSLGIVCAVALCSPALARDVPIPKIAIKDFVQGEFHDGKAVELEGYVKYAGEILLFDSREAAKQSLIYPYCISANFPSTATAETRAFDRKRVKVSGRLFQDHRVEPEPNTIQTYAVIEGTPFKNWCLGPYVLKIDEITVLS